ncbi:hypothetical protein [Planctomicrobium piriforme]|uniref:Uncharacterized protein n=1 Tax=Planctomicrobium piriforme TaxID=1576369 RepID=A0A1I3M082_9PLAN|nr:hypothetical protein [Planctomicrobium piriforme]SFI90439.1 hypothetical protein SAMN05421753_113122 [Planctomicrobium piriforme]
MSGHMLNNFLGVWIMGAAVYIAASNPQLRELIFVDGKMIARHLETLSTLAEDNGLRRLEMYLSQSAEETKAFFVDQLGVAPEEIDMNKIQENWYSPEEGSRYFTSLRQVVEQDKFYFKEAEKYRVLDDINSFIDVISTLRDADVRWHLAVDF